MGIERRSAEVNDACLPRSSSSGLPGVARGS